MKELQDVLKFYKEIGASFLEIKCSDPKDDLNDLNKEIKSCTKCPLYENKKNYVTGEGSIYPDIFFIGEGPGATEDQFGRPFIGKAGQLLSKIIKKMGYSRESVFIGNIIKCRPPGNREPLKEEVEACLPYLKRQIKILKPKVLVCLGRVAFNNLMGANYSINKVRGEQFEYENIPVIPTFHPSYILHQRTKENISKAKWSVWEDMLRVLDIIKGQKDKS